MLLSRYEIQRLRPKCSSSIFVTRLGVGAGGGGGGWRAKLTTWAGIDRLNYSSTYSVCMTSANVWYRCNCSTRRYLHPKYTDKICT